MSKVLIVSDSHGWTSELLQIKEKHKDEVDLMLHCGDSELQADDTAIESFVVVRGNCDFEKKFPEESIQSIGGKKILLTHGHLFNVKSSLMSLQYRAEEVNASIVCFGHTHIVAAEVVNGILFLNPGSVRLPKMKTEKTYMILEKLDDKISLNVYDINLGILGDHYHEFNLSS